MTNFGKSILWRVLAFIFYSIPMLILFIVKSATYTTNSKLSFFGILIIGFMCIAFAGTLKKIFNYDVMLSVNAIIFIIALLSYFMGKELIVISLVSFCGSILSLLGNAIANTYYRLAFITDEQGRKRKDKTAGLSLKEAWEETISIFK